MSFPPYSYVPGHWPHPSRDPEGHAYGADESQPPPLDPEQWWQSAAFLRGFELFDHGFYWEAHEAWEGLWIAAGRTGPTAELLQGLIKLAASAVKARQGYETPRCSLAQSAAAHFAQVQANTGQSKWAGLDLEVLNRWAVSFARRVAPATDPRQPVEILFLDDLMPSDPP